MKTPHEKRWYDFTKSMPWEFEDKIIASPPKCIVKSEKLFRAATLERAKLSSLLRSTFGDGDNPMAVPVRITVQRGKITIEAKEAG